MNDCKVNQNLSKWACYLVRETVRKSMQNEETQTSEQGPLR